MTTRTIVCFVEISITAAVICTSGSLWGQTTAPAPPAAIPAAPVVAPAADTPRQYTNVPIDTILNDIARRFNIIMIKPASLSTRVTLRLPGNLDADQALSIMQNLVRRSGLLINAHGDGTIIWELVPGSPEQLTRAATRAQEIARQPALPPDADPTMKFQFVETPIETILDEISARLGIEIDRAQPIPGRITIIVPEPVNAVAALRLLNAILADARYTAIPIDRTNADGSSRLAVRIGTYDQAKKGDIPVE